MLEFLTVLFAALPVQTEPAVSAEAQILRGALALIKDESGWCTYSRKRGNHSYCALGAIGEAAKIDIWFCVEDDHGPVTAVIKALAQQIGAGRCSRYEQGCKVALYNNTHTHAEVVAWFKATGNANGWL